MKENTEYSSNVLILCRKKDANEHVEIDKTFLSRLLNVLRHIRDCYGASDMLIDEEIFYLINTVNNLRYFQLQTIGSEEERDYFKNIGE
jgi:hypothetical protein